MFDTSRGIWVECATDNIVDKHCLAKLFKSITEVTGVAWINEMLYYHVMTEIFLNKSDRYLQRYTSKYI